MSDATFPIRTAGDLTLPNGDTVWVCQLNKMLHDEVGRKANWYAQKECRRYLKGGADYPEILAQVKALDAAGQAAVIARQEYPTIVRETSDKFPLPERPEQGEQTPQAFTKACAEWEADCKKVEEKRAKAQQSRWDAEIKMNVALTNGVRIDRACSAIFAEEWSAAFTLRWHVETMHRAVRVADDHTRRYFASPEAYEDADDAVQEALREFFYVTLAEPKSADIPTSPAAS